MLGTSRPGDTERFAGLHATRGAVHAAVAGLCGDIAERRFELTMAGLAELSEWLESRAVSKVALRQGRTVWPWQAEAARRRQVSGPLDLDYWLEYSGPDSLARADAESAWQPTMLALRERFALFVVRGEGPANRGTAERLARALAAGAFLEHYPKPALERLIARLLACEGAVVAECLSFFTAESRGHWHNRARAKIARRLKHCPLDGEQTQKLVATIERRLIEGRFTEQFKDQLRLLRHLDPTRAARVAETARCSPVEHVARYGAWLAERAAPHHGPAQEISLTGSPTRNG